MTKTDPGAIVAVIMAALDRTARGDWEGDTFDRCALFAKAADEFGLPYDDLYYAWLNEPNEVERWQAPTVI